MTLNAVSTFNMSHVMRKPVYAICEQQRRRSACTSEPLLYEIPTIFILINAPGALQFTGPKYDVLEAKYGQIYQYLSVQKPFWSQFPYENCRGCLLERGRLLEKIRYTCYI